jgi:hypothetical protein
MVLIEFQFTGKNIEDQEFHSIEQYGDITLCLLIVVFIFDITLRGICRNNEWTGNDMKIKIHLLW